MSHIFEIEKPDEIRCPYCLSWNSKNDAICSECTTKLYDTYNFGAVRALFSWENSDPARLSYIFSSESKDKISHWNAIFQVQFGFFRKEFPSYTFLFKYAVLDIQEEVCKYFLSSLPMRPEVFKEFKEYDFPENGKNETELLSFMFRTHPASVFKALAGMALIHKGKADVKILQFLHTWNAHYKKLHREKLLSYAHWSVQKLNFFAGYSGHVNEVMPLLALEGKSADWTKIFLYKADYEVQELRFALEDIITGGTMQIAVSACFALRRYDRINDLLLHELDESTIELAYMYSDERHIPGLLLFLRHAPAKYHEPVIRRCVQLKPADEHLKEQIVAWLLEQGDHVLPEVLFAWSEIPRFEEVMNHLLQSTEGIQALLSFLPAWMRDNRIRVAENPALHRLLEAESGLSDTKAKDLLLQLKTKVAGLDFDMLCEDVRKNTGPEQLKRLFALLFAEEQLLNVRQIADGFYSLIKVAENTSATTRPYFVFLPHWGMGTELSEEHFHTCLSDYLSDNDTNRPAANWLFALYDMLTGSKAESLVDAEIFVKHTDFVIREMNARRLDAGTSGRFLKLIHKLKNTIPLNDEQQRQLQEIASGSNDFEMKYWVEQIIS